MANSIYYDNMLRCKCGSLAITVDEKRKVCDVCYWRNKFLKMRKKVEKMEYKSEK
jgi:hypothetical protein